jgi:uncharacterized protein YjbJ (UPF0337 family)
MKSSTKNEIAGKVHEVKGQVKQKIGHLTKDKRLEAEGIGEELAGKLQSKLGQAEKVIEKS